VEGVHPHRFRHTFAIWFLRNGGNPLELQRILGHEKLETVLVYVRLAEVDIERAAKSASPVDGWKLR
jgi:site-specific recombinase XerD